MATKDFANNFYMAKTFATTYPEIVAILKGHPLYPALSKKAIVPSDYLTQMWKSLTFLPDSELFHFELVSGKTFRLQFDLELFRRTIGFPLSNAYPDKLDFEQIPSNSIIVDALNALGYEGRFKKVSEFKRNLFAKRWCILYMIINRCLTHSYSGIDSLTKQIAQVLYGVAYHRHIDFAQIIWSNLIKITRKKNKFTKYIPYIRFLSIILDHFLNTHPEIPTLADDEPVFLSSMKYIHDNTGSNVAKPAVIPQQLLILADRNDKAILRYRELVASTEPAQPQALAPRARRSARKGSSRSKSQQETEEKREEGDLGEDTSIERRQKRRYDSPPEQPSTEPSVELSEPSLRVELTVPAATPSVTQDPPPSPSTGRFNVVMSYKKKKTLKTRRVVELAAEEAPVPSEQQPIVPSSVSDPAVLSSLESGHDDTVSPFNDEPFVSEQPEMELQGGIEEVVQKSGEIEQFGSEIGQRKRDNPPRTTPKIRETTSAAATHMLRQSNEEVIACPPVHAQTHHGHSVSQQRETIPSVHEESSHNLPSSHSGQGIESYIAAMTLARMQTHQTTTMAPLQISQSTTLTSSSSQSQSIPQSHTQPQSQTQQQFSSSQPSSILTEVTWRDLKALFYSRLLIQPTRTPTENAVLSLLSSELSSTTQPPHDLSSFLSRLDHIDRRLSSLESCRPFPTPSGRRHDDPDSQDPPEEKNG